MKLMAKLTLSTGNYSGDTIITEFDERGMLANGQDSGNDPSTRHLKKHFDIMVLHKTNSILRVNFPEKGASKLVKVWLYEDLDFKNETPWQLQQNMHTELIQIINEYKNVKIYED